MDSGDSQWREVNHFGVTTTNSADLNRQVAVPSPLPVMDGCRRQLSP